MNADVLNHIAETDSAFQRQGDCWVGRCIICNSPIRFEVATGEGATVEHIIPRSRGGGNDPLNLGIAHGRCNAEKGRRWDPARRHRGRQDQYAALTERILRERARRFRTAATPRYDDESERGGAI